jgi:hypothetical protein
MFLGTDCRNCHSTTPRPTFTDLGSQPLANSYLGAEDLDKPEVHYPLRPTICTQCGLVQLPEVQSPQTIFRDYAYMSGQSQEWVAHVTQFAYRAIHELDLTADSQVCEIASNDGTTLRAFREFGIPALGIEPAANIARMALLGGLATIPEFMGIAFAEELVDQGYRADLICAANVMAHVPNLDDFLGGIRHLLKPTGTLAVEFPDLDVLVRDNLYETIYHEHFSVFSRTTAIHALESRGFEIIKTEILPTHGGSLRIWARRGPTLDYECPPPENHLSYGSEPAKFKHKFVDRLMSLKNDGSNIVGYGAAAKASTQINYCGIGPDLLDFIVDSTPTKQGKYLPGSHVQILPPEALDKAEPDVVVIFPANWAHEIAAKLTSKPWKPTILCRLETLNA